MRRLRECNRHSGRLEPDSMKGFIAGVRGVGIAVAGEEGFLKWAQGEVFAWAKREIGT